MIGFMFHIHCLELYMHDATINHGSYRQTSLTGELLFISKGKLIRSLHEAKHTITITDNSDIGRPS